MAIAGLQNVLAIDTTFPRDSASRQRENEGRSTVRASSLLQMWRDLEDDHVMSHHGREMDSERNVTSNTNTLIVNDSDNNTSVNELGGWSPSRVESHNSSEDLSPYQIEHSTDLGMVERERVRQTFRGWMSSGTGQETSSSASHTTNSPREYLGETEQERVRIIREMVQKNTQQRPVDGDIREEQPIEVSNQIERVLDGMVVNGNCIQKRGIRKLCGRQVMLDMLKMNEMERKRELEGLMQHHAVTNFAHRNRIQALLRGRFLRNSKNEDEEKPTSSAATELGFLRERQTVTELREEFISRLESLDRSVSGQAISIHSDVSSNAETDDSEGQQDNLNCGVNINDADSGSDRNGREVDNQSSVEELHRDNHSTSVEERTARVENWQGQLPENMPSEWRQLQNNELSQRKNDADAEADLNSHKNEDTTQCSSSSIRGEDSRQGSRLQETIEISNEQSLQCAEEIVTMGRRNRTVEFQEHRAENISRTVTLEEQTEEEIMEGDESDWQLINGESSERRDDDEEVAVTDTPENFPTPLSQISSVDEVPELTEMQADDMELQSPQEEDWSDEHSDQETVSDGRPGPFFRPNYDNENMELRELSSRRRVSSLLQSGFRENLNHLIQSYMDRRNRNPLDLEEDENYHDSALVGEEQDDAESESGGQELEPVESLPPVHEHWDNESPYEPPYHMGPYEPPYHMGPYEPPYGAHDLHHHNGMDWESLNYLRNDMGRIQERMNNLQRMLEACMEMQLELQRSIRQEVSAAMYRFSGPSEDSYESKWDYVKRGICCICCERKIDSLLYRCGHMNSCEECGKKLVEERGRCPMCLAPVIEVVRAYPIN